MENGEIIDSKLMKERFGSFVPKVGFLEDVDSEIARSVSQETKVEMVLLQADLARFDELYRREKLGQLQIHEISEKVQLIEYLTLERLHERWQVFPKKPEELRAELFGAVSFWVDVIDRDNLSHVVHSSVSPHWTFSYSLYVACRIRDVPFLTVHSNPYFGGAVVHEGIRERVVRFGPPALDDRINKFLVEMADRSNHVPNFNSLVKFGSSRLKVVRNIIRRIYRGWTSNKRIGSSALYDIRDRRFSRLAYAFYVLRQSMFCAWQVRQLKREYEELCVQAMPDEKELGRSVVFFAHLQPEAATAPPAFFYHDFRLVVKELTDKGYAVYYKEQPLSFLNTIHHNLNLSPVFRSVGFYRELVEMGCKLLDVSEDNDRIFSRFDFVATCTGTVGLQAVVKGKWVINFGAPWYAGMPGTVDAHAGLLVNAVELSQRAKPRLSDVQEYFREVHGLGLPSGQSFEDRRQYLMGIASLVTYIAE